MRRLDVSPPFENPLAYTEAMQALSLEVAGRGQPIQRLRNIQDYLFDDSLFPFRYGSRETRSASEAFESRSGNCVSFTNLFIAMARAAGIWVEPALAAVPLETEKEGDLVVINTHAVAVYRHGGGAEVFDFDRRAEQRRIVGVQPVDDLLATAIYANNLGAEALLGGRPEQARELLETAVRIDPAFAEAHGNLGIVRRQLGDIDGAFEAYRLALAARPRSPTILANLAALYRTLGRDAEANNALQAARLRGASPYMLISRGDLELTEGRVSAALDLYRRAARLDRQIPEPWVAIARAELAVGHTGPARKAVEKALERDPENDAAKALGQLLDQYGSATD